MLAVASIERTVAFGRYDKGSFNQQIDSEGVVDDEALVADRHWDLPFDKHSTLAQRSARGVSQTDPSRPGPSS
jgi:hypothetical protein